jgi:hypothetical protein
VLKSEEHLYAAGDVVHVHGPGGKGPFVRHQVAGLDSSHMH